MRFTSTYAWKKAAPFILAVVAVLVYFPQYYQKVAGIAGKNVVINEGDE